MPKPEGPEKPGGGTKAQPEKHRDHSDIWREPFAARFCRMRAEGAKPALRRLTRLKQGGPAGFSKGRGKIIFNRPFPCRGVCSSDKPDACPQIRRGSILQREAAGTGGAPDRGYGRERKYKRIGRGVPRGTCRCHQYRAVSASEIGAGRGCEARRRRRFPFFALCGIMSPFDGRSQ